jgi:DNA-directed RNA polymerase specialized sigma subunit
MSVENNMKQNIDGSINTVFVVQKPYSGCELTSLVKPIDPLLGIGAGHEIVPEKVHGIFTDENMANKVAEDLYEIHIEEEEKLEEKKVQVERKLKTSITELEKIREENTGTLKEDPTNSEIKEQIANLTEKINNYLETLKKISKSKKNKKEKEKVEEGFLSNISASAKGAFTGAKDFGKSIGSAFKGASDVAKSSTVNEKIKNLGKEFTSFISDIDKMIEKDQIPKNLKIDLKKYKTELEKFEKANKKYIVEPEKKEEPKKNTDKKEGSKENNKKEKEERKKRREELEKTLNNPDTPEYLKKKIEALLNPKKEEEPETKPAKPEPAKPAETEKTRKELKPPENIKSKSKIPQGNRNKKTQIKEGIIKFLIQNK